MLITACGGSHKLAGRCPALIFDFPSQELIKIKIKIKIRFLELSDVT